ncbi:MAG TPA: ABC transporter permease [Methanomassiliicoccales archaeon]|jgi:ABC-type Na+ efflux pump permease subunit
MSLGLLFRDELRGFYKSKVMLTLWVGLPVLTLIIYYASPTSQDMSLAAFTAILIGSIGGMLSAAMLVSSIISEKSRHVFDLFIIRPVKRRDIVLSKFLATYVCVTAAGIIALVFGALFDLARNGAFTNDVLTVSVNALIMALSMTAIACSAGVLIGFFANSMLTGIILVIYGANQLSVVAALPGLLVPGQPLLPLVPGVLVTALLLAVTIRMFDRKQL